MQLFINILFALIIFAIVVKLLNLNRHSSRLLYSFIGFCVLFLCHCLLDINTMHDLLTYKSIYEDVSKYGPLPFWLGIILVKAEPGYILFNYVCSVIYDDFLFLVIISSFIMIYAYSVMIYKHSAIPLLSFILVLCIPYYQSLFVLRQHMALALCLLSYTFIVKRRLAPFLLVTIFAAFFHSTALIFLPAYWVFNLNINRKFWIFLIVGALVGFIFNNTIFVFLGENSSNQTYLSGGTNYTGFCIQFVVFAFSTIFIKPAKLNGFDKAFFISLSLSLCLNFMAMGSTFSIASRLFLYYNVAVIFILPLAVSKLQTNLRIPATVCIICFYALMALSPIVKDEELGYKYQLISLFK